MPTKLTLVTQLYPRGILLILLKFQILAKCGLEYLLFSQHGILLNNNIVYPDLKAEEPVILNTERSRRLNYKVFKKYAPVNEAIEQFLSAGADAVVMVEYTAEAEGAKKVQVFKEIEKEKNVAVKGEDIHGWQ